MSSQLKNLYRLALNNYPLATQAVQASLIMASSDVIAQCAVEKTPISEINWVRTGQFGGMGLFFVGPALRLWYGKLDTFINPNQKAWKRALKKVSFDQLLFAPVFTAAFTSTLSVVQGMKTEEIVERLKKDYINILVTNYTLWPAAQLINFSVIPLNYQVVFAQMVAVVWNTYLSMKLGSTKVDKEALEA